MLNKFLFEYFLKSLISPSAASKTAWRCLAETEKRNIMEKVIPWRVAIYRINLNEIIVQETKT